MSAEPITWERVEAVLDRLLLLPADDRRAALPQLCGDDAVLRREVEAFLVAHEQAGEFLETGAAAFAARHRVDSEATDLVNTRIGPYRLVEEIGRGGMGRVWLAERADGQFDQRVALKLIKRGMDSGEILARFLRERQILARLEHPNIARLLDGGVSADGRPFFVMEYVKGAPITQYCKDRGLSLEERLRRFTSVAHAVHYAHRNLVVHRDLKPSNVLVAESGEIKLLDFGVAKLLSDENASELTAPAGRPMTPEYGSPEQVLGQPVTTASDVYQLGVLLYELLTGRRPYEIVGRSAREIERSICESHPRSPSAMMVGTLRKRLKGDLDTIVLRALRKEPEQRYPSAEALAEDIERHLDSLPLRFPGGNRWYATAKFLRRNRTPLGLAAVFSLLLLGFGVRYTFVVRQERDHARQGEAKASESAALIRRFFQGWSPDAAHRGAEVSAAKMLDDARSRAERELAGDPVTLASTLSVLGELEFNIGRSAVADSLLQRAFAIQVRLPGSSEIDLAATLARQGRLLLSGGRFAAAEAPLRRALALYQKAMPPGRTEVLMVQTDLAESLWQQSKLAESESQLREALSHSTAQESPITTELGSQLGYVIYQQGRIEEAIGILRPVLERQRRIFGAVQQPTTHTLRRLASALRDNGELAEAESLTREALRATEALYGSDHPETEVGVLVLAMVLEREGRFEEADSFARQSIQMAERLFGVEHVSTALGLRTLAAIRMARGDPRDAEQLLRRALAGLRRSFPNGHPEEGDVLNRLAYLALTRHAPDADSLYRETVRFEASRPPAGPWFVTDGYEFLGESARLQGDRALAERMFRRAVDLYRKQLPAGHPYRVQAENGLKAVRLP